MTEYIKEIRKKIGHDMLQVAGAGVIVYKDGRVLLQKRRDNHCWAIHGGVVEIGETVEAAARRELLEETGLTAHLMVFFGVFSGEDMIYTYPNGDTCCIISIVYMCCDFSGEPTAETDETSGLRWFDVDSLPADISPPDQVVLRAFADHILKNG